MKEVSITICCSSLSASISFCVSFEVDEHLIAICLCGCAVVKKCNCACLVGSRLALRCLGLGNSLLASASWVDSACLLAIPGPQLLSFSLRLLPRLTQLAF